MKAQDKQIFDELETLQVTLDGIRTRQALTDAERVFLAKKLTTATASVLAATLEADTLQDETKAALEVTWNGTRQNERSLERVLRTLAPERSNKNGA